MWFFKKKQPAADAESLEQLPQTATEEQASADDAFLERILQEFSGEEQPEAALDPIPIPEDTLRMNPVVVPETEEDLSFANHISGDTMPVLLPEEHLARDEDADMKLLPDDEDMKLLPNDEDMKILPEGSEAVPAAPISGDTMAFTPITEDTMTYTPVSGDTMAVELPEQLRTDLPENGEPAQNFSGDTVRFDPITDEQAARAREPYSEGWEPQYEQPIGEYIPPQPILFHPRSRLRELKRKLVAGPERRYYELSERGFTRMQFAIFFCLLVSVFSAGATVFFQLGMLAERVKLVAFLQLFGMLIAALLGTNQLIEGVADLFQKRFSLNSLLVLSFFACIADGVFGLKAERIPCCAAFSLQMTMSLWSSYQKLNTEMGQMDTMRKATHLDSIVAAEDYHEGTLGLLRGEGQVEDFMENYNERTAMEKATSIYAIIASLVSIAGGVAAGVLSSSVEFGVQVLATSLLVSVPATYFIAESRPMAILEKRLHKLGTVLCGWSRTAKLAEPVVFPLTHEDLFPAGCIMLNGVKFYGTRDPDQVVAYATAVITADGGGLTPLFDNLLTSRNGRIYEVENMRLYGGGGIGGEVCGEPVLVGMQDFLKSMGVEIPEGTMVNNAVYVAIDGELCGLFAVTTTKTREATQGLSTLCGYRGLRPILVTGDFMLTEDFIHDTFGVNIRRLEMPDFALRAELAAKKPDEDAPALALTTHDGLAGFAFAVTGARSLRTASTLGTVVHMVGGGLGIAMVLVLAILGATGVLIPVNMLLYQLIWMIPGLLITEWTRAI